MFGHMFGQKLELVLLGLAAFLVFLFGLLKMTRLIGVIAVFGQIPNANCK